MPRKRSVNGSGMQPRQRKDGLWEVRYQNENGQIKSLYGHTAQEVEKKKREAVRRMERGEPERLSKRTFAEWAEEWLNTYCIDVKPLTVKSYRSKLDNHLIPAFGKKKLTDIRPEHIQSFINAAVLSPKSVSDLYGLLHHIMKQAQICQYIVHNPCDACKLPRRERHDADFVAGDDFGKLIKSAQKDEEYGIMIIADLLLGVRIGELCGLTWDCINFDKHTVTVKQQVQYLDGEYKVVETKNSRIRVLSPSDWFFDLMKSHRQEQIQQRIKSGDAWQDMNLVFCRADGSFVPQNTLRKHHKRILEDAGLDDMGFHSLRHSYAVFSLEAGDNIKDLQNALGHYSAAFTLNTYEHISENARKQSALNQQNALQKLLNS